MSKLFTKLKTTKSETPNIFKKLFLGFVIVPIIPIITLLYFTQSAQSDREKVVQDELINSANLIGENIDNWVDRNIHISRVVSQTEDIRSMLPERQKPLLVNMKRNSEAITAVRVDDANGQAITRSDDKKLKNYADRQYFQQVKYGESIGQQVIFGKTQQKPLLCLTVPIDNSGSFVGALSQCSTLDDISKGVTNLQIGQSGFAFLVDGSDKLIAYGGTDKSLTGKLEDMSNHPALLSKATEGTYSFQSAGKDIVAYRKPVGLGWTLVMQQDYKEAFAKPTQSRNTAILATILTSALCLLIIWFLSRLIAKPLQEARKETDNILGSANDGLFLIDKDFRIGSQQSANLSKILQEDNLAGKSFIRYLFDSVSVDVAELAKDYTELLFSGRIKEELVQSRNPLKRVKTNIENSRGEWESRYLSLTFKRVISKGEITHLLVTAKDITKEVKLEEELAKTKEEKEEQSSLLTDILHIPPQQLMHFLEETNISLNEVNVILEQPGSGKLSFRKKIDDIFNLIHKVKGDASAINFELFVKQCHEFEDQLEKLKTLKDISGNDFLPVTLSLESLFQKRYMVDELFQKIASLIKNDDSSNAAIPEYLQDWYPLKQLADNVAAKHDKSVELHFRGFKTELPSDYQGAIKDIATQLIRNSIVHGIESPNEREKSAKLHDGQIAMSIKYSYGRGYVFTYTDDGTGIDYNKIKSKLVQERIVSSAAIQNYTEKQLIGAMFKSGFSSQEDISHDAGRGVGLSLVADKVKAFGGKIQVSSVEGKRTVFKIILPCKSLMAA